MSADDKTPTLRKIKPRIQTSDDRDAAALQRRNMAPPLGVPIVQLPGEDPENMTGPFDLFEPERAERRKRPGDSVAELAAKLRRGGPDAYDLLAQLAFEHTETQEAVRRERRATESQSKELDAQFKAFMSRQPGGKEFDKLKSTVTLWKWIGGAILTAALGSLGIAIGALWSRAEHEGENRAVIERLKSDVQQLLSDGRPSRHQPKDTP